MNIMFILKLVLLFNIAFCSQPEMIIQLFKSGARNPEFDLPGFEFEYGFEREKDLSETGMRQMFNLGRLVRHKYPNLVVKDYDFFSYNLTSSDRNRTHASSYSFLQGIHDHGQPILANTPDTAWNWTPPFMLDSFDIPEFSSSSALPNELTLTPVRSFYSDRNYMFNANKYCPNLKSFSGNNIDRINKEYSKLFKSSYEAFDEAGFEVYRIFDNEELNWNFVRLSQISDLVTCKLYAFADQEEVLNKIPYNLRAHMMLINAIWGFAKYDRNKYLDTFNTKLFESWLDKLENFKNNFGIKKEISKVELYSGHMMNVASVIQSLVNRDALYSVILKYREFLDRPEIKTKLDYDIFLEWIYKDTPYADLRHGSNIIIEVFSENDELFVKLLYNFSFLKMQNTDNKFIKLNDFIKLLKSKLDSDFNNNCGNELLIKKTPLTDTVGALVIIFILLLLCSVIFYFYYFKKIESIKYKVQKENLL